MNFFRWLLIFAVGMGWMVSCRKSESDSTSPPKPAEEPDAGIYMPSTEVKLIHPSLRNTLLGRPTKDSIAVSVLADTMGDGVKIEFGTQIAPDSKTILLSEYSELRTSQSGEPIVVELEKLQPDTQYFYRLHFFPRGQTEQIDNIHSFRTQRAKGKPFRFAVQGDTHPERYRNKMFHQELFRLTMEQVRDHQPDLYFTLGDDFGKVAIRLA